MKMLSLFSFLPLKIALIFCFFLTQCSRDLPPATGKNFHSKFIVIVVQDGARFSETFGDSTYQHIPGLFEMMKEGVLLTNFRNTGGTYTVAGHTSLTTGVNQWISNGGMELPAHSSIFHHYLKMHNRTSDKAWIIASKGKLSVLSGCLETGWKENYYPSTDCGIMNDITSMRHDTLTLLKAKEIIKQHHPGMMLVQFREPDVAGHSGIWTDYIDQIKRTDSYIKDLWSFIQSDNLMKGRTTLFVTNDHGRHLDHLGGISGHGDDCDGCRNIFLLTIGPDLKQNYRSEKTADLRDIASTIAYLSGFSMSGSEGRVLYELFR